MKLHVNAVVLPVVVAATFEGIRLTLDTLPPLQKVRDADPKSDDKMRYDVRTGEVVATVTLTAAAGGIALITQNATPFFVAIGMSVVIISLYEWAFYKGGVSGPETHTLIGGMFE